MVREGLPRWVEVPLAALGLLLALPILILAGLLVGLTSEGGALFIQHRVGRGGRRFPLVKLRTMRVRAGRGPQVTARGDRRVTPVGRVLRALKIDELPALWNVVRGDMSLVGPRPEVPRYVSLASPLWREVLKARPGITDPVTLRLRNEEELLETAAVDREVFYRELLQPYKLLGYCDYLATRSWRSDLGVIVRTLAVVLLPRLAPPPTLEELHAAVGRVPPAGGQSHRAETRGE